MIDFEQRSNIALCCNASTAAFQSAFTVKLEIRLTMRGDKRFLIALTHLGKKLYYLIIEKDFRYTSRNIDVYDKLS